MGALSARPEDAGKEKGPAERAGCRPKPIQPETSVAARCRLNGANSRAKGDADPPRRRT